MRSSREEECSGPAPSNPCGNSITIPLCRNHLAGVRSVTGPPLRRIKTFILSAEEMKVSITTCWRRMIISWETTSAPYLSPVEEVAKLGQGLAKQNRLTNWSSYLCLPDWQDIWTLPANSILELIINVRGKCRRNHSNSRPALQTHSKSLSKKKTNISPAKKSRNSTHCSPTPAVL
jgi:hypothetical protein